MLQSLLERREEGVVEVSRPNIKLNIDIAKLLIFNGNTSKVLEFLMACKFYVRMKMKDTLVEEQI